MRVNRKTPPFRVSAWIEVKRGDDMVEVEVSGMCREGAVEVDVAKRKDGMAFVVLSDSEHRYALEILISAAIDHGEDSYEYERHLDSFIDSDPFVGKDD